MQLIEGKGRAVFATRCFQKGEYVVEYHGDLLQITDAKKKEAEYAQNPATGCYMYYFQYLCKTYWYDKPLHFYHNILNNTQLSSCWITEMRFLIFNQRFQCRRIFWPYVNTFPLLVNVDASYQRNVFNVTKSTDRNWFKTEDFKQFGFRSFFRFSWTNRPKVYRWNVCDIYSLQLLS